jgi:hypothetical protein
MTHATAKYENFSPHEHEYHSPTSLKVRREALEMLDEELARLKHCIALTDEAFTALDLRASQLEEIHRLRHERIALFDDDERGEHQYNMTSPSASWNFE